jgi:hypothetical protein
MGGWESIAECMSAMSLSSEMIPEGDALGLANYMSHLLVTELYGPLCASYPMQVTEQAALSQVEGLRSTIAQLESLVSETQARARQLEAALDAQTGVNRQLMAKKEAVEWELMAALAKVRVWEPMLG